MQGNISRKLVVLVDRFYGQLTCRNTSFSLIMYLYYHMLIFCITQCVLKLDLSNVIDFVSYVDRNSKVVYRIKWKKTEILTVFRVLSFFPCHIQFIKNTNVEILRV